MSADNGIYIGEFPDGFRVIHAQCIENLDYHKKGSKKWRETVIEYFGESFKFESRWQAGMAAETMRAEVEFTEYGICDLGRFDVKMPKTEFVPAKEPITKDKTYPLDCADINEYVKQLSIALANANINPNIPGARIVIDFTLQNKQRDRFRGFEVFLTHDQKDDLMINL